MQAEVERLRENRDTLEKIIESGGEGISPHEMLVDYLAPIILEFFEQQIMLYDEEGEEEEAQMVGITVSTYVDLQNFVNFAAMEPTIHRDIRKQAIQVYAQLRSDVDGMPLEDVITQILQAQGINEETPTLSEETPTLSEETPTLSEETPTLSEETPTTSEKMAEKEGGREDDI